MRYPRLRFPAPFEATFDGLEEVCFAEEPGTTFHECFGCGPHHEIGLRVRRFPRRRRGAGSDHHPRARFEGPPQTAHGGIVAAYLDEIPAGAALSHTGRIHVTGELTI